MNLKKYVLKGHEPKEVDLMTWAQWIEQRKNKVARTRVKNGVLISTIFLGLDHQYGDGPPLLFETMIFGGENDGYQSRYSTWEEAEDGHKSAIKIARQTSG